MAAPGSRSRPLAGVRVLDLTRVLAGPVATRWLAALGADVLRIDPPDWDEPAVIPEVTLGKRCARLDVKLQAGRDHLVALLASADVLVHGYRPGALAGLGLDDQERDAIRPGLIDVSLDAYGWSGPWAARRGFDSLVQMSAGIAAHGMVTFGTDEPRPLPVQALDHATGYLMATAVLRSLTDRLHDGRGTRARMSLARTGSLLVSMGAPTPEGPAIVMGDEDFDPRLESTAWGALRRLRPPAEIVGTPLAWDGPAVPLGSVPPSWAHRT